MFRFWERTPQPKRLLHAQFSPLSTSLKVDRDFTTGDSSRDLYLKVLTTNGFQRDLHLSLNDLPANRFFLAAILKKVFPKLCMISFVCKRHFKERRKPCFLKFSTIFGEKPGLVVREEDSRPRGRGFESRHILDGCKRFASYYIKRKN
jgi:hypothetical protein